MAEAPPQKLTFEQALTELERIVHDLEDSQTSLEDALDRYEKGVGLIKHCYAQLRQAEQRILMLTGTEDGQPLLKPFEHTATAESQGRPLARPSGDPGLRRLPPNNKD